jgi:HPt (histidine-containing phosphotransfer) domain-containing protein
MEAARNHLSTQDSKALFSITAAKGAPWSLPTELRDIVETDSSVLPELVSIFLTDSSTRLKTLSSACFDLDFKIVRAQAHSLKGSALQMGAAGLGSLCAALEASEKPQPEYTGPMMRSILDEFALVRQAMKDYLCDSDVPLISANSFPRDSVK